MDVQSARVRDSEASWSWAPYAPEEALDTGRFATQDWAPASSVRYPWVRVGRWTVLYRRPA